MPDRGAGSERLLHGLRDPGRAEPRPRQWRRRAPAPIAPGVPAPPPGTKQAYALSFSPLGDERLRYRVARWVVDRAPAHALTEVQEDLAHGTFVTFLALTADEAEVARQGIHGLGVAPPLLRLAPASMAEMLLPRAGDRRRRSVRSGSATGAHWSPPPWGCSSSAWWWCV